MAITKDLLSKPYEISSNKGSLIPGKKTSAKKTAATRINPLKSSHTELQKHMVALSNIVGTIDDTKGLYIGDNIEPVNIEKLPTVINSAVAEIGGQSVEWYQIKALPGYIQTGIRMVGRAVFGSYTKTAIEDIQVLSSLVNPENDVKGTMNWIRKNGVQDHSSTVR